ncbi:hypothetical protein LMG33818_000624 [Halomonadaceae bacterium LMG 33818]|uniref:YhdP family phospholipid transporter n=1 Tax=Cernens ardua TaxID=3402176 RepID=UPI003EDC1501
MTIGKRLLCIGGMIIAVILAIVAIIILSLRLFTWHITDDSAFLRWIPVPSSVKAGWQEISFHLEGPELVVSIAKLHVDYLPQGGSQQHYNVEKAHIDLNLWRSLRLRQPAFDRLDIQQPNIRLVQSSNGEWFPPGNGNGGFDFTLSDLERWVTNVAGSRASITQGTVDLEGLAAHHQVQVNQAELVVGKQGKTALQLKGTMDNAQRAGVTLQALLSPENGTQGQAELFGDAYQVSTIASMFTLPMHYDFSSQGKLHAQLHWRGMEQADLRIATQLPSLHIDRTEDNQAPLNLQDVSLKAAMNFDHGKWTGAMADLGAKDDQGNRLAIPSHGSIRGQGQKMNILLPDFQLEPANLFWGILPISPHLETFLTHMHPRGHVWGATISFDMSPHIPGRERVRFQAGVFGAEFSPYDESPGVGPINGWVDTTLLKGSADLQGSDSTLEMPHLFARAWPLDQVSGTLNWITKPRYTELNARDLMLQRTGAGTVKGNLLLSLPDDERKRLALNVKLENGKLTDPLQWVPVHTISKSLGDWLTTNIHQAEVPNGSLDMVMVFGAPEGHPEEERKVDFADPKGPSHLHLDLTIKNGKLGYMDGWPPLDQVDGQFSLNGEDMKGTIQHADLKGLTGSNGIFSFHDHVLKASAPSIVGDASGLLGVLQEAHFDSSSIHTQFNQWSAHGPLQGNLSVEIPFDGKDAHKVHLIGQGSIHDATAVLNAKHLTFSQLSGQGKLEIDQGKLRLTGTGQAHAFDGPAHAVVDLNDGVGGVRFSGRANAQAPLKWLGIDGLAPNITGPVNYTGSALIRRSGGPFVLSVRSNLRGLALPFPAPLGKSAAEVAPLNMDIDLSQGIGSVNLADRLFVRWRHEMKQGQIWVQQWPSRPTWQSDDGWVINWHAPRLDPMAWQSVISRIDFKRLGSSSGSSRKGGGSSDSSIVFNGGSLKTECLVYQEHCLGSLFAIGYQTHNNWYGQLKGPLVSGSGSYVPSKQTPINITLDHVALDPVLNQLLEDSKKAANKPKAFSNNLYQNVFTLVPNRSPLMAYPAGMASVPAGHLEIQDIQARNERGHVSLDWHADASGITIPNLKAELAGSQLQSSLRWSKVGDASVTTGRATLEKGDIARLFALMNQPKVVTTPHGGRIDTSFSWPGAPWQPDWRSVTGTIEGHINGGNFESIQSNSARLIGLLNLDNLFRRLRLDFTDLTGKGIAFNHIDGGFALSDGLLTTSGPIVIRSPITTFSFDGQVDLIKRTLDEQLNITLPVSETLPIAALAIGAPEIGGILLLLHWAFGHWVDQVTELHYAVSGPWTQPTFKMERPN